MSKKLEEIKEDVSTLSEAIRRLDQSTQGLARSFGQFGASGNTTWNIISRLSSGTGFWRLQNRVRAVSNVFQEYFDRQTKSMEATLENLDANLALEKSLKKLQEERRDIMESPLYKMFERDAESAEQARAEAEKYYDTIIKKIDKQTDKRKKAFQKSLRPDLSDRLSKEGKTRITNIFRQIVGNPILEVLRPYGPQGMIGRSLGSTGGRLADLLMGKKQLSDDIEFDKDGNAFRKTVTEFGTTLSYITKEELEEERKRAGFLKQLGKGIGKLLSSIRKIITLFAKALVFSGLLLLVLPLLLPTLKRLIEKFDIEDVKDFINRTTQLAMKGFAIFEKFAKDVFSFYSALFKGDFDKARRMYMNFLNFVVDKIVTYGPIFLEKVQKALVTLGRFVGDQVYKLGLFIVDYLKSIFNRGREAAAMRRERRSRRFYNQGSFTPIRPFAAGGMTSSGYSLVGEQGPELLKLPVGSRIRSNRETMDMIGTTNNITVQVTGRVGASDQEIKDIARKVSREINLQMNRTGSTAVRF